MNRLDYITNHLRENWAAAGLEHPEYTADEWPSVESDDSYKALGFIPPVPGNGFVSPICPEVVAQTTSHLNTNDLEDYLDTIEYLVAAHNKFHMLPDYERRIAAEGALLDEEGGEAALRLVTEVHLALLDRSSK